MRSRRAGKMHATGGTRRKGLAMWRPTRDAIMPAMALSIVLLITLIVGVPREGAPSWPSGQHTALSAWATTLVALFMAAVAATQLVRALWRGGGLVRGPTGKAEVRLTGGERRVLGRVRLRPGEALRVQVTCSHATRGIVPFYLALGAPDFLAKATSTGVVKADFAWEAEEDWVGVLRPPETGTDLALEAGLEGDASLTADMCVRWWASPTVRFLAAVRK